MIAAREREPRDDPDAGGEAGAGGRVGESRAQHALRSAWRLEAGPDDAAALVRVLAVLRRAEPPASWGERLAAAGGELAFQSWWLERLCRLAAAHDVAFGEPHEIALLEEVRRAVSELVDRIERTFGSLSPPDDRWWEAGLRETFLVGLSPETAGWCRWLVRQALMRGDAPEPTEPLGRAYLRATGEDLGKVGRYLGELAAADVDEELLAVVAGVGSECRRWAETIVDRLTRATRAPVESAQESP